MAKVLYCVQLWHSFCSSGNNWRNTASNRFLMLRIFLIIRKHVIGRYLLGVAPFIWREGEPLVWVVFFFVINSDIIDSWRHLPSCRASLPRVDANFLKPESMYILVFSNMVFSWFLL